MYNLRVDNVHSALHIGSQVMINLATRDSSRNGDVMVMDMPVTTMYEKPKERVLFWAERDANPFFHFMEGLWMLEGRKDVKWISQFSSNIENYSDNGKDFHGAYGYRWRNHFGFDQLDKIATILRNNPKDRRAVLQMWDATVDLGFEGKDFPCNLMICFRVNRNALDMTVFNRSNDMVWGAYGANAVHMSMLQEVMAAWTGTVVGSYWQVSNNFHLYEDHIKKYEALLSEIEFTEKDNPYRTGEVMPYPMVNIDMDIWFQDLKMFVEEGPIIGFRDRFFRRVASPMYHAWSAWKNREDPNNLDTALEIIENCHAEDWKKACKEWLLRRQK